MAGPPPMIVLFILPVCSSNSSRRFSFATVNGLVESSGDIRSNGFEEIGAMDVFVILGSGIFVVALLLI